jgi:uncharacterized protein (DUF433 family)
MTLRITSRPVPLTVNADGNVLISGTRVPLYAVILAFQQGQTAEQIAEDFPSLHLADIYAVISYYLHHKAEVDAYMQSYEKEAAEIRKINEQRFPSTGLRDRLLAKHQAQQNLNNATS